MIKILPRSTKMKVISIVSATTVAAGTLVGLNKLRPQLSQQQKDLIEQKEFVRNHAPEKFDKLLNEKATTAQWNKAVQAIKDSLKNDSIARLNYIKAAQNLRKAH